MVSISFYFITLFSVKGVFLSIKKHKILYETHFHVPVEGFCSLVYTLVGHRRF